MGLRIVSFQLDDFRNYERYLLDEVGGLTVLVGKNGVGKTNIFEGIRLVTSGTSFRHSQINQLIRKGAPSARLSARLADENRDLEVVLELQPGKKRYVVNGKAKSAADVRGLLPSVSFTPDDLEIAKKSSSVKRAALDDLGSQLSRNYYIVQRDFEKALRYKNRLLKEEAAQTLVDAMNETLLTCATQLYCYRHALYRRIVPLVAKRYAEISQSGETFQASYLASWDYLENADVAEIPAGFSGDAPDKARVRQLLETALGRYAAEERVRRRSLVGPHNDKISFYLDEGDASSFASQGQQRSIVLSWKLAEVEVVRQSLGVNPVLLLDDVMSELDERRRDMLVSAVGDDIQTFISSTDLSPYNEELLSRARVVKLSRRSEPFPGTF